MVSADSFCGDPVGDASGEEAFGGVGGIDSSVWVSARASVMLPDSLADSASSCSDLASEDAGAGGGGGIGAGMGWGGERGADAWSSRRRGEGSTLGGGGDVGGCGGDDGEESPERFGGEVAVGAGGGGGGAGVGFSGEMDPWGEGSTAGCCEGGEAGATGSAGCGGRIGEAMAN
uniref:Uncharacterized protein n=1 Tax=Arundo donax TaxID=35708 RepID=A0A0A9A3T3_ARUDO